MNNKPNRTRNHSVCVRLSDQEYDRYITRWRSSGLSKQDYLIDALTTTPIISASCISSLQDLNDDVANYVRKVSGMATNINQIAHKANAKNVINTAAIEEATEEFQKAKEEGEKLWRSIRSSMATVLHMDP